MVDKSAKNNGASNKNRMWCGEQLAALALFIRPLTIPSAGISEKRKRILYKMAAKLKDKGSSITTVRDNSY
jgi:hypothetical protein